MVDATIDTFKMRFTVPCGTKCIVILLFIMFLILNIKTQHNSSSVLKIGETISWPHEIKLTKPVVLMPYEYNHEWDVLFRKLELPQGCHMIDIGANIGDTSLNMAAAAGGKGRVVAFEMGPPADILRINIKQNPQFQVDLHEVAVSDSFGSVAYHSNSGGANGGIPQDQDSRPIDVLSSYQSVKLYQYLQTKYKEEFIQNICFMKTDTEGHDITILEDLHPKLRPSVIWTEWFREYKFLEYDVVNRKFEMEDDDYCTKQSAQLFQIAISLGYEIFKPKWPLQKVKGCANKYYEDDLLLINRSFLLEYLKKHKIKMDLGGYKINVVYSDSE